MTLIYLTISMPLAAVSCSMMMGMMNFTLLAREKTCLFMKQLRTSMVSPRESSMPAISM